MITLNISFNIYNNCRKQILSKQLKQKSIEPALCVKMTLGSGDTTADSPCPHQVYSIEEKTGSNKYLQVG